MSFVTMFAALTFVKVFHWLVQVGAAPVSVCVVCLGGVGVLSSVPAAGVRRSRLSRSATGWCRWVLCLVCVCLGVVCA